MTYPIAMPPYINMAPYCALSEPRSFHFVYHPPRDIISALLHKEIVAAAMPVGGLPFLRNHVELALISGISAMEKSMSMLFFSDRPFYEMDASTRIRITGESASGVRLMYLTWGLRLGFENLPVKCGAYEKSNGELVIGNQSLIRAFGDAPDKRYPYVTDLVLEWYDYCGLPFVFSRWAILKDAPVEAKISLLRWLEKFRENEEELVNKSVLNSSMVTGLSHEVIETYFRTVRRTLTDEDVKGQENFLKELDKHESELARFINPETDFLLNN